MKTMVDRYPEAIYELFKDATDWMEENYSYVPYMEPARDGFIAGYTHAQSHIKQLERALRDLKECVEFYSLNEHVISLIDNNYEDKDGYTIYDVNLIEDGVKAKQCLERNKDILEGLR
jgi:hypothetical protein